MKRKNSLSSMIKEKAQSINFVGVPAPTIPSVVTRAELEEKAIAIKKESVCTYEQLEEKNERLYQAELALFTICPTVEEVQMIMDRWYPQQYVAMAVNDLGGDDVEVQFATVADHQFLSTIRSKRNLNHQWYNLQREIAEGRWQPLEQVDTHNTEVLVREMKRVPSEYQTMITVEKLGIKDEVDITIVDDIVVMFPYGSPKPIRKKVGYFAHRYDGVLCFWWYNTFSYCGSPVGEFHSVADVVKFLPTMYKAMKKIFDWKYVSNLDE